jgi:polyisoprenoid-binding protein YceI
METVTLPREETAPVAGTLWEIDPDHSTVGFAVKHMMVATVHGLFHGVRGTIRFDGDQQDDAAVEVEIDAASVDTGIRKRDDHLRSADFFDAAVYPTISFRSTRIEPVDRFGRRSWLMTGDLTMSGVTRSVKLAVVQAAEPSGRPGESIEFSAKGKINRKDFGMEFNLPIEGGGLVVGDEVKLVITVQANRVRS